MLGVLPPTTTVFQSRIEIEKMKTARIRNSKMEDVAVRRNVRNWKSEEGNG